MLNLDRNFTLEDVHVEGTERIAEAVAKYDVDRYIHVSSHNADVNSPSEFFATKVCLELESAGIVPDHAKKFCHRAEVNLLPEASSLRQQLCDQHPFLDSKTTSC
jgi:hypothetical protein